MPDDNTVLVSSPVKAGGGPAGGEARTTADDTQFPGPVVARHAAQPATPPGHLPVPAAGGAHRRREPRFQPIDDRLWLQWWEGEEYLGRAARLVNVSRHGAMMVSPFLFREGQSVRIFLEEPAPQIGVDSVVLGVLEGSAGLHQIRLAFRSVCPDDFIAAAADGFESWLSGGRPGT